MKKIYEQAKAVFNSFEAEDVITSSGDGFYSSSTTVHQNDVYDFSSFIA